jgi:hypothetical protein
MGFSIDSIDPSQYVASDLDETGDPSYYGFIDVMGNWYILQKTTAGALRYTMGNRAFPTNWTGRAGLTYDYFYNAKNIT